MAVITVVSDKILPKLSWPAPPVTVEQTPFGFNTAMQDETFAV